MFGCGRVYEVNVEGVRKGVEKCVGGVERCEEKDRRVECVGVRGEIRRDVGKCVGACEEVRGNVRRGGGRC